MVFAHGSTGETLPVRRDMGANAIRNCRRILVQAMSLQEVGPVPSNVAASRLIRRPGLLCCLDVRPEGGSRGALWCKARHT
jgi:hypothetical protein